MRCFYLVVGIAAFLCTQSASGAELNLTAGTRTFGGSMSITVNPKADVHRIYLAPSFSYLIADNVEFGLSGLLQTDLGGDGATYYGVGLGMFGYLDLGTVLLKSGAGLVLVVAVADYGYGSDSLTLIDLVVPLLLVVPLSDSVALNFGAALHVFFSPEGGDPIVQLPIGLLGVQAYF